MIQESFIVSQTHKENVPEYSSPVYRVRYGKTTKYLKERSFLGFIKYYTLVKEETVWDDYFVEYDGLTGEKLGTKQVH